MCICQSQIMFKYIMYCCRVLCCSNESHNGRRCGGNDGLIVCRNWDGNRWMQIKNKRKENQISSTARHRRSYLNGCGWASVRLARATLLGVAREETLRCAQQELLQLDKFGWDQRQCFFFWYKIHDRFGTNAFVQADKHSFNGQYSNSLIMHHGGAHGFAFCIYIYILYTMDTS